MSVYRVLLISLEPYQEHLDDYLQLVCDKGPFFDQPVRLPVSEASQAAAIADGEDPTSAPVMAREPTLKSHFRITLPQVSPPGNAVDFDFDLLMCQPSCVVQLRRQLNAEFLAPYHSCTVFLTGDVKTNETFFENNIVKFRLANELSDRFLKPLVVHLRETLDVRGEIPITLFATEVDGGTSAAALGHDIWPAIDAPFAVDMFKTMQDVISTSQMFGEYKLTSHEVSLVKLQDYHLPWVLLARMLLFNLNLRFSLPRTLIGAIANQVIERQQNEANASVKRNEEYERRRQAVSVSEAATITPEGMTTLKRTTPAGTQVVTSSARSAAIAAFHDDEDGYSDLYGEAEPIMPPSYTMGERPPIPENRDNLHNIFSGKTPEDDGAFMDSSADGPGEVRHHDATANNPDYQNVLMFTNTIVERIETRLLGMEERLMDRLSQLARQLDRQDRVLHKQSSNIRRLKRMLTSEDTRDEPDEDDDATLDCADDEWA